MSCIFAGLSPRSDNKNNAYKVIIVRTPIKYISDDDEIQAALEARADTLLEMQL